MNREDLIGLIFDAVSDSSKWRNFLEALRLETGANRATFMIRDVLRDTFTAVSWVGSTEEDIAVYARYAADDPWNRLAVLQTEGVVLLDSDYCSRAEAEASLAFREFYLPRNCLHGFGGVIVNSLTTQSIISLIRGREHGPFGATECATLQYLMPYLRRAVLLHREMENLKRCNAAFTQHLDRYPHALCLLDSERRIVYRNRMADEVIHGARGLKIVADRLVADPAMVWTVADSAFDTAMAAANQGTVGRVTLGGNGPETETHRILFLPVRGTDELSLGGYGPTIAAIILDLKTVPKANPLILRELYSLTRAEAEIAVRVGQGLAPAEIAAQLSISKETIKTHIRRIMAKTGTNQRGALVAIVLRSTAFGPG